MTSSPVSELSDARRLSRFVVKTLIVVGAVVIATLGAAVAVTVWTTDAANDHEAGLQKLRVQAAIQGELNQNIIHAGTLAAGRALIEKLTLGLAQGEVSEQLASDVQRVVGFDGAYVVDAKAKVHAGVESGAAAGQAAYNALTRLVGPIARDALAEAGHDVFNQFGDTRSPGSNEKHGISRLVHDGSDLIAVTALPFALRIDDAGQKSGRSYVFVGYRTVRNSEIRTMAHNYGISEFALTGALATDARYSIPLMDATGVRRGAFVWSPARPGSTMLAALVMVIVVAMGTCLALFVIIVGRLRQSALQFVKREDEIQRLAGHDPLSGLPNRRAFERAIDGELVKLSANGGGFAVHFLDLDKFKAVNDTYGHKAGDELIRQVAKRLTDLLRGADTLVRFGGDEFAIVQTEVQKAAEAAMLGQRILEALTRPFTIDDIQVLIGVSIGIALAPQNSTDRDTLANLADTALYQAKNEGRNRYNFFEKQMDKSLHMRRVVEDDLRDAINNDELVLHYQPQISADGRSIVGVEALVRWPHKTHGMIPPAEFISIAEERGLIMQLSDWVLRRACTDGLRWPHLRLAVNVSPIQFRHHDFVSNVAAILSETGFEGARLELELTEGVVVDDADKAEAAMVDLRALGIGLALDDFGTGYSSLIYLRRFAFDKIKIDRSFLEYMETTGESAILVHSVVHLGRALGLRVCAEGVETAEQHRFLQAVGCHELQGYFFSKPIAADELDALLELENPFAEEIAA